MKLLFCWLKKSIWTILISMEWRKIILLQGESMNILNNNIIYHKDKSIHNGIGYPMMAWLEKSEYQGLAVGKC